MFRRIMKIFAISAASVIGAFGIYTGVLAIAGEFSEKPVFPTSIYFEKNNILISGDPDGDAPTYSFKVLADPNTVNQKTVTIELISGSEVVSIPSTARIGEETIITVKNDVSGLPIGGTAILVARANDNTLQTTIPLTINVDRPVTDDILKNDIFDNSLLNGSKLEIINGQSRSTASLVKSSPSLKPIDDVNYQAKKIEYYILDENSNETITNVCDLNADKSKLVAKNVGEVKLTIAVFPTYYMQAQAAEIGGNWTISERLARMVSMEVNIIVISDNIVDFQINASTLPLKLFELTQMVVNDQGNANNLGIKLYKTGGVISNNAFSGLSFKIIDKSKFPEADITSSFELYNVEETKTLDTSRLSDKSVIFIRPKIAGYSAGVVLRMQYKDTNLIREKQITISETAAKIEFSPKDNIIDMVIPQGMSGAYTYDLTSNTHVFASIGGVQQDTIATSKLFTYNTNLSGAANMRTVSIAKVDLSPSTYKSMLYFVKPIFDAYTPSKAYNFGDTVMLDNRAYLCVEQGTIMEPSVGMTSPWKEMSTSEQYNRLPVRTLGENKYIDRADGRYYLVGDIDTLGVVHLDRLLDYKDPNSQSGRKGNFQLFSAVAKTQYDGTMLMAGSVPKLIDFGGTDEVDFGANNSLVATSSGTRSAVRYKLYNVNATLTPSLNNEPYENDENQFFKYTTFKLRENYNDQYNLDGQTKATLYLDITDHETNGALQDIVNSGKFRVDICMFDANGQRVNQIGGLSASSFVTITNRTVIAGGYRWEVSLLKSLPIGYYVNFAFVSEVDKDEVFPKMDTFFTQDRIEILSQAVTQIELQDHNNSSILQDGRLHIEAILNTQTGLTSFYLLYNGMKVELTNDTDWLSKYIKLTPSYTSTKNYSYNLGNNNVLTMTFDNESKSYKLNIINTGSTTLSITAGSITINVPIEVKLPTGVNTGMSVVIPEGGNQTVIVGDKMFENLTPNEGQNIALYIPTPSSTNIFEKNRVAYTYGNNSNLPSNIFKFSDLSVQELRNGALFDTANPGFQIGTVGDSIGKLVISNEVNFSNAYYLTLRVRAPFVADQFIRLYLHSSVEVKKNVGFGSTINSTPVAQYDIYAGTDFVLYDSANSDNTAIKIFVNGESAYNNVKTRLQNVEMFKYRRDNANLEGEWVDKPVDDSFRLVDSGNSIKLIANCKSGLTNAGRSYNLFMLRLNFNDGNTYEYIVTVSANYFGVLSDGVNSSSKALWSDSDAIAINDIFKIYSFDQNREYISYSKTLDTDIHNEVKSVTYASSNNTIAAIINDNGTIKINPLWVAKSGVAYINAMVSDSAFGNVVFDSVLKITVTNPYELSIGSDEPEAQVFSIDALTMFTASEFGKGLDIKFKYSGEKSPLILDSSRVEYSLNGGSMKFIYMPDSKNGDINTLLINENIGHKTRINLAASYAQNGVNITREVAVDINPLLPAEGLIIGTEVGSGTEKYKKIATQRAGQTSISIVANYANNTIVPDTYAYNTVSGKNEFFKGDIANPVSIGELKLSFADDDHKNVVINADNTTIKTPSNVQNGIEVKLNIITVFGYVETFVVPITSGTLVKANYPTELTFANGGYSYEPITVGQTNGTTIDFFAPDSKKGDLERIEKRVDNVVVDNNDLKMEYKYDSAIHDFDATNYITILGGKVVFKNTIPQDGRISLHIYDEKTGAFADYFIYLTRQSTNPFTYSPNSTVGDYNMMVLTGGEDKSFDLSSLYTLTYDNFYEKPFRYTLITNQNEVATLTDGNASDKQINNIITFNAKNSNDKVVVGIYNEFIFFGTYTFVVKPDVVVYGYGSVITDVNKIDKLDILVNNEILSSSNGMGWLPQFTYGGNLISPSNIIAEGDVANYFYNIGSSFGFKPVPSSTKGSITFVLPLISADKNYSVTLPITLLPDEYLSRRYSGELPTQKPLELTVPNGSRAEFDFANAVAETENNPNIGSLGGVINTKYFGLIDIERIELKSINDIAYVNQDVSKYFVVDATIKTKYNFMAISSIHIKLEFDVITDFGYVQKVVIFLYPDMAAPIYKDGAGTSAKSPVVVDANRFITIGGTNTSSDSSLIVTDKSGTNSLLKIVGDKMYFKYALTVTTPEGEEGINWFDSTKSYLWFYNTNGMINIAFVNLAKELNLKLTFQIIFSGENTYYDQIIELYVKVPANYSADVKYVTENYTDALGNIVPLNAEYFKVGDKIKMYPDGISGTDTVDFLERRNTENTNNLNAERVVITGETEEYNSILYPFLDPADTGNIGLEQNKAINKFTVSIDQQYSQYVSITADSITMLSRPVDGKVVLVIKNSAGVYIQYNLIIQTAEAIDSVSSMRYNGAVPSDSNSQQMINAGNVTGGASFVLVDFNNPSNGAVSLSTGNIVLLKKNLNLRVQRFDGALWVDDEANNFTITKDESKCVLTAKNSPTIPTQYRIVLTSMAGVLRPFNDTVKSSIFKFVYSPNISMNLNYGDDTATKRVIFGATTHHNLFDWVTDITVGGTIAFGVGDNPTVFKPNNTTDPNLWYYMVLKDTTKMLELQVVDGYQTGKFNCSSVNETKEGSIVMQIYYGGIGSVDRLIFTKEYVIVIENNIEIVFNESQVITASGGSSDLYVFDGTYVAGGEHDNPFREFYLNDPNNSIIHFGLRDKNQSGNIMYNALTYSLNATLEESLLIGKHIDIEALKSGILRVTNDVVRDELTFKLNIKADSGYVVIFTIHLKPSITIQTIDEKSVYNGPSNAGMSALQPITIAGHVDSMGDEIFISTSLPVKIFQNRISGKSNFELFDGLGTEIPTQRKDVKVLYTIADTNAVLDNIKFSDKNTLDIIRTLSTGGKEFNSYSINLPNVNKECIVALSFRVYILGSTVENPRFEERKLFVLVKPIISVGDEVKFTNTFADDNVNGDTYKLNIMKKGPAVDGERIISAYGLSELHELMKGYSFFIDVFNVSTGKYERVLNVLSDNVGSVSSVKLEGKTYTLKYDNDTQYYYLEITRDKETVFFNEELKLKVQIATSKTIDSTEVITNELCNVEFVLVPDKSELNKININALGIEFGKFNQNKNTISFIVNDIKQFKTDTIKETNKILYDSVLIEKSKYSIYQVTENFAHGVNYTYTQTYFVLEVINNIDANIGEDVYLAGVDYGVFTFNLPIEVTSDLTGETSETTGSKDLSSYLSMWRVEDSKLVRVSENVSFAITASPDTGVGVSSGTVITYNTSIFDAGEDVKWVIIKVAMTLTLTEAVGETPATTITLYNNIKIKFEFTKKLV